MFWLGLQRALPDVANTSCTTPSLFRTRTRSLPPLCLGHLLHLCLAHCPQLSHLSSRAEPGSLLMAGDSQSRNRLAVHTVALSGSSCRPGVPPLWGAFHAPVPNTGHTCSDCLLMRRLFVLPCCPPPPSMRNGGNGGPGPHRSPTD